MVDIGYWFFPTYSVFNFPEVLALFARSPWRLPLLMLERYKIPANIVFGLDMVGSTSIDIFLLLMIYLMILP